MLNKIKDFSWYAPHLLKIKTKTSGVQPFKLRKYQLKFLQHLKDDFPSGIIRSVSLKPRQAGWSTLISGINFHSTITNRNERGLVMADKLARTSEVHGIYSTFLDRLDPKFRPMIDKNNSDEIYFDNPNKLERENNQGLGSGFKTETAQDPNAGRAGSRRWAHLSEFAFYPYAESIDEGIQNSIPLAQGTRIFKESTAFGMTGCGESFYHLCLSAMNGDSIYKFFFVAWYEIDDYQVPVPNGFILNKDEIDLVKMCPDITNENLAWRRLKLSEYRSGKPSVYTPEERFSQDYPSFPEQAFLSTGRPVFNQDKIKKHLQYLKQNPIEKPIINYTKQRLNEFKNNVTVYEVPQLDIKYVIGADVAEGLEDGDFSTAFVIRADNARQVAKFKAHIDSDVFGELLVELAKVYNNALLVPEINNMGIATLIAIKNKDYFKLYRRSSYDEIEDESRTDKLGWRTTATSKQTMLSRLVAMFRDDEILILDEELLREMLGLSRESDGNVDLGGKDLVVSACLALMGLDQIYESATVTNPDKKANLHFETKDISRKDVLKKR